MPGATTKPVKGKESSAMPPMTPIAIFAPVEMLGAPSSAGTTRAATA